MNNNTAEKKVSNTGTEELTAWNILSTMGFYTEENGKGTYVLGNHHFPKMTIQTVLEGKTFTWKIFVKNLSYHNTYVRKILLNGHTVDSLSLNQYPLLGKNAQLVFEMSDSPYYFNENEIKLSVLHPNSYHKGSLLAINASIIRRKDSIGVIYLLFLIFATWNLCGLAAFLFL